MVAEVCGKHEAAILIRVWFREYRTRRADENSPKSPLDECDESEVEESRRAFLFFLLRQPKKHKADLLLERAKQMKARL